MPADLLLHRPLSTDAGEACTAKSTTVRTQRLTRCWCPCGEAITSLCTALAALPTQQRRPGHKLAVLVPYRDRAEHLAEFLPRIHAYLTVRCMSLCGGPVAAVKQPKR